MNSTNENKFGTPRELNFAENSDLIKIKKLYEQIDLFEKNFPFLNSLIVKSQKVHPNRMGRTTSSGYEDCAYIDYIGYNSKNKSVSVKAVVSLVAKAYWIDSRIELESEDGEYIGTRYLTTESTNRQVLEFVFSGIDLSIFSSKVIKGKITSCWHNMETNRLYAQQNEDSQSINTINVVTELVVTDPIHKKTKPEDFIMVVYNRTPGSKEVVDYDYTSQIIQGFQQLILDCSGKVKLSEGKSFNRVEGLNLLVDSMKGVAFYGNEYANRVYKTTDGFEWKLNNDWKDIVPTSRLPQRDPVNLRMKMNFYCNNDSSLYDITIASDLDPALEIYPNHKKISQLLLLWGCCAEGTKILMADGTEKRIEEIQIGESVICSVEGAVATVENTWSGNEPTMVIVRVKTGQEIWVTKDHPFIAERGVVAAIRLTGADRLLMYEGGFSDIDYIYDAVYEGTVHNLTLRPKIHDPKNDGTIMVGNGFIIGDNELQGKVIKEVDTEDQYPPLNSELKLEIMKLIKLREELNNY